ncbi:unnamed protein product [Musa acuminata subsp. burmannicoides]
MAASTSSVAAMEEEEGASGRPLRQASWSSTPSPSRGGSSRELQAQQLLQLRPAAQHLCQYSLTRRGSGSVAVRARLVPERTDASVSADGAEEQRLWEGGGG